jgi:4-amino-4-deoxy-L-arabinose transferase-like glycosyltransferase
MFLTLLAVDLIILLLRFIYIFVTPFDLSPEEAQYWDWSRHLDLSYYSKPPLIAYLNWVSTHLFGNTEFAVRFWPAIFGFLSSLLIYRFAALFFKDKKLAFWLALLPNALVGFDALSFVFTTDTPLFFFWGLSLYLLWRAVETEKTVYWFLLGVSGGLGFLAKYSMALFFPLGVAYILFKKPYLLKTLKPYLSTVIGLLFTLPVIYWNYLHDWVSFKHVLNLSGVERKTHIPNWKTFFNFLISQTALLGFGFFFYLLWGWVKNFTPKRKGFIFTLFSFYPYLVFQLLALKKSVYGNWAGFAYFSGGMLAGYYYIRSFKKLLPLSVSVLALSLFLTAVAFYPPLLDKFGMTKVLPPKKDPTRVMVGWENLGRFVSKFYNPEKDFIFSNLYQISAEMAFYVKGNPQTYVFNYYQRMNQYDLWEVKDFSLFLKWLEGANISPQKVFNWKPLKGKNGIFITPLGGVPKPIKESFKRVVWRKEFPVRWRGEVVRVYYIFYLEGFKGNYNPIIRGF